MMILLPLLAALILGLVGGLAGSRWIRHLYRQQPSVLSFPEQQTVRSRFRPSGLASILTILFCWIMLTIGERGLQLSICLLLFDYFLVLYTFTDFEQQVIFDRMLIPFAIIGLLQTIWLQQPLLNHLAAAAAGCIIFLLLAVLTHGGIGGGDIKLIAALGLWLGTDSLLTVAMAGLIFGGIAAFFLLVSKQKKRGDYFAYGPYFTIAAILLQSV
jgi:leader peptidase (prepilin peptidase)/N-methyltransferase